MDPLVCAVIITNGRPKLTGRAVRCFNRQVYRNKLLYVLDTTPGQRGQAATEWLPELAGVASIGGLRNLATASAIGRYSPDILIHFDDDDWSHAKRMAYQVDQLQNTREHSVGFSDMLWWDSTVNEAWHWSNGSKHYNVGGSLCYWPETWRNNPFPDPKLVGGHDIGEWPESKGQRAIPSILDEQPMIIAEYHGANGACTIKRDQPESWQRVAEWDGFCRKTMTL